jgi:hypothetical protein
MEPLKPKREASGFSRTAFGDPVGALDPIDGMTMEAVGEGAPRDATPEEPAEPAPDQHGRMTVEQWAKKKATEAWKFKAAKAGKQWPDGQEVTEEDYDAAIKWLESDACSCR